MISHNHQSKESAKNIYNAFCIVPEYWEDVGFYKQISNVNLYKTDNFSL